MAVQGLGHTWNLPNYSGELFTAAHKQTPFLTMIGGLTNGGMTTANYEFPTSSEYDLPAPKQPSISEKASATAPEASHVTRGQQKNVTQIFHEAINITYRKSSNSGRLQGINTAGQQNNAPSEKDFQIARKLEIVARDVEWTFLNGQYQNEADGSTPEETPSKTRGMFELVEEAGHKVDASAAKLEKDMIQQLLRDMATGGALFSNVVLFVNAYNKQMVTDIYGYAPEDRNIGGLNIKQIETDFAQIGVVYDPFVPTDKILLAEMSVIAPVFQPVEGKGILFYEELAKTGAAESGQLYGQIGLAHGPGFAHGAITNLATE